jgi:erythromycin esterase
MIRDWLRANAVRLSSTDPTGPLDELEPLRDIVGDARVVALGESSHWLHEIYGIKHRIVRFLAERMGFSAFALESGWSEGLVVDDWIRNGKGDLDTVLSEGMCVPLAPARRCATRSAGCVP